MQGGQPSGVVSAVRREFSWSMTAMGVFLWFGAVMAFLAGTTLIWRGTLLDRIWVLNASAYRQLAPFGKMVGVPFLMLSAALGATLIAFAVLESEAAEKGLNKTMPLTEVCRATRE